jgi:hypothetical protein
MKVRHPLNDDPIGRVKERKLDLLAALTRFMGLKTEAPFVYHWSTRGFFRQNSWRRARSRNAQGPADAVEQQLAEGGVLKIVGMPERSVEHGRLTVAW